MACCGAMLALMHRDLHAVKGWTVVYEAKRHGAYDGSYAWPAVRISKERGWLNWRALLDARDAAVFFSTRISSQVL